jgi:ATP/maltotriose-dependent transcriptional regulator MalT
MATGRIAAGKEALARGAWEEARGLFEEEARASEQPEALEGVGVAARWLIDVEAAWDATERAYRLYRGRGDDRGAGRCALTLSLLAYNLRREEAVTRGWLERSRRLLDGLEPVPEAAVVRALDAHVALLQHNDAERALALCAETIELARACGAVDPEMVALGLQGLALVTQGEVDEGLRRLDAAVAAAVGGDVADPDLLQTICCYLIYACKRVRDFDRAEEWCRRVQETARRWSDRHMFAICRVHYADVLLWRGAWADAEVELEAASGTLDAIMGHDSTDGRVRLADLRCRQGRLEEADAILSAVDTHPLAALVQGELALERGDALGAADGAERVLRRVPADLLTERTAALELLVRARIATGEVDRAAEAVAEIARVAGVIATDPLRGAHAFAAGLVAAARGDYEDARRLLEDAVDLLAAGGSRWEAARARVALGRVLDGLGRRPAAEREARAALAVLDELGAAGEARRARALLSRAQDDPSGLTRREREILRLIAVGESNEQIAAALVLSARTVERHVSNIYAKLGLTGRAARAAAVAYATTYGYA